MLSHDTTVSGLWNEPVAPVVISMIGRGRSVSDGSRFQSRSVFACWRARTRLRAAFRATATVRAVLVQALRS